MIWYRHAGRAMRSYSNCSRRMWMYGQYCMRRRRIWIYGFRNILGVVAICSCCLPMGGVGGESQHTSEHTTRRQTLCSSVVTER